MSAPITNVEDAVAALGALPMPVGDRTLHGPLWSLLDWSFWGAGMGDLFREALADRMIAAVPAEGVAHAEAIMSEFIERRKIEKTGVTVYQEQRIELERLRTRVDELEKAAVEGRAALGSLCYDLEDPGTAALGALYLLSQATTWNETSPDFAADALARHACSVLDKAADMADPDPPEVSFFGDHGSAVAGWLRMLAERKGGVQS
ncbi:hypothetical protein [Streptomyces chartreusis]